VRATRSGARVLIAEDDPGYACLLALRLSEVPGVDEVTHADDGAEAVQLGLQRSPDIAVFDIGLPKLNGLDAAVALRDLQPSLRIAMQSGERALHASRTRELGLRLFDKVEIERIAAWVRWCAAGARHGSEAVAARGGRTG
jgi:DNA-binding NarL/FixJ family response regulator